MLIDKITWDEKHHNLAPANRPQIIIFNTRSYFTFPGSIPRGVIRTAIKKNYKLYSKHKKKGISTTVFKTVTIFFLLLIYKYISLQIDLHRESKDSKIKHRSKGNKSRKEIRPQWKTKRNYGKHKLTEREKKTQPLFHRHGNLLNMDLQGSNTHMVF